MIANNISINWLFISALFSILVMPNYIRIFSPKTEPSTSKYYPALILLDDTHVLLIFELFRNKIWTLWYILVNYVLAVCYSKCSHQCPNPEKSILLLKVTVHCMWSPATIRERWKKWVSMSVVVQQWLHRLSHATSGLHQTTSFVLVALNDKLSGRDDTLCF